MKFPFFKANSNRDILAHLGIIIGLCIILLLFFFYLYLPFSTNHGETVTVPDVQGMALEEIEEFLDQRDLNYEVTPDSGYSSDVPALTVLKQYPKSGSKVKEGRKIYISVNAQNPPKVKMPKLISGSLKNAQLILQSYGLKLGDIRYEPNIAQNAVLNQLYKGSTISEGTYIPKGARIDLIVGDGLGKDSFPNPDLVGMPIDEATEYVKGSGLVVGSIIKQISDQEPGTVLRQSPEAGQNVHTGEIIDIWVAGEEETEDN